jgi:hypothetical protein
MRWEDTTGHASVVPGYRDDPTVLDGGAGEYSIAVIDPAQPASQPASQPGLSICSDTAMILCTIIGENFAVTLSGGWGCSFRATFRTSSAPV